MNEILNSTNIIIVFISLLILFILFVYFNEYFNKQEVKVNKIPTKQSDDIDVTQNINNMKINNKVYNIKKNPIPYNKISRLGIMAFFHKFRR